MLTINQIKDVVVPIAREFGVERVYLFGSYARGEQNVDSDIDLKIETGNHPLGLFRIAGLEMEIEKNLGKKVDVVTEGGLFEQVKSNIEKDQVLLYEK